jgi:hypothetical protein
MAKIRIQGVEYPTPERFNNREIALIQRVTGFMPAKWEESLHDGDVNMQVAIAMIVLTRAGQTPDIEKLYDLEPGFIEGVPDEADASPPVGAAEEAAAEQTAMTPLKLREASGGQG